MNDKQIDYESKLIWTSIYFYICENKDKNLSLDEFILGKIREGMKKAREK